MSLRALAELQARFAANDRAGAIEAAARVLRDPRATLDERVEALRLRSIVHERARDLRAALADIEAARALKPLDARLANEAGLLCADLGERENAVEAFRRAVALDPRYHRALSNLGTLLSEMGDLRGAMAAYDAAVAAKPDYALGWANLGNVRRQLDMRVEATEAMQKALAIEPGNKAALMALGALHRSNGDLDSAIEFFGAATRADPRDPDPVLQLATALAERNDVEPARRAFAHAQVLAPSSLRALFGRHLLLPLVYESEQAMRAARAGFVSGLATVEAELPARAAQLPGRKLLDDLRWINWLLPYHGENDRPLQERFARVVAGAVDARAPEWRAPLGKRPRAGRRLRVGFLSAFFRDGTVGRYFQHWITDLDAERFEVVVYHLAPGLDGLGQRVAARADVFRRCPLWQPSAVAKLVRDDALDALVYPELGLEPTTFALAGLRLAPLQCAAWGHPTTSGHATIDAYFSCAAMEPPEAASHYTERLILLPGIGTRYARPPAPDDGTRERFGLPTDGPLFLCPQTHYKIHPASDALLANVLAASPGARIVMFRGKHDRHTSDSLRRLSAAFAARGVDPSRLVVLPMADHGDYMRVNALCDAMLDTLHWSGGNTSLDAIAAGLPVVTLPGRMMRGRQTLGMLTLLGIDELVARDEADYVSIAVRLASDPAHRDALSARIRAASDAIFDDRRPVQAVADFLLEHA